MGSYRAPEFAFDNVMTEQSALSVISGLEDPNGTQAGVFRVVDGQHARPAQIKASGSNPVQVQIDRFFNSQPRYTRLIIPEGHNLDGWSVRLLGGSLEPAANPVFGPVAIVGTDRVDETFASVGNSELRFQVVKFEFSPADDLTIDLPEIYLTNTVVPLRGPQLRWDASVRKNVQRLEGASGVGTSLRTGPDRQTWSLDWTLVDDIATFLTPLEQAVRPFWFLPPDDDFDWDIYEAAVDVRKSERFRAATTGSLVYEAKVTLSQVLG